MQVVKEVGRKEADEWKGFRILWFGIIQKGGQMEVKECIDEGKL